MHNLSKRQNVPEWGNRITREEHLFCPPLFEVRNKKEEGRRRFRIADFGLRKFRN